MIHEILPVGPLQCNCSILGCSETKEAVIIDPGDEGMKILERVVSLGLTVKYILHTHAHFDHVGATDVVHRQTQGTICLHQGDDFLYQNLPMQGKLFGMEYGNPPPVEKFLVDEEEITFGDHTLQVLHTPGHSPGSICFRLKGGDEKLFSGDTLFQQSIGRADLWGGDASQLLKSVRERIFTLEGDMPVYPGHGPNTFVGEEKRTNPFFR